MQQAPPPPKNTPGRRRQNRNGTPQKSYASENDAASYRQDFSNSPSTPQKSGPGGPAPPSAVNQAQSTTQKQRSKNPNKSRGKVGNGTASPGANQRQDRQSPSFVPAHAQAAPAFAGATFHHSPAPSSLPIPSFLARTASAPDSPSQKPSAVSPSQEPSPPTTDSEGETSAFSHSTSVPRNEESPLDFFFQADRAEKARARRASSANLAGVALGPFSPPHDSPQECRTFPKSTNPAPNRRPNPVSRMSSGISANELDGTPGQPYLPAFSTPYQERIRAARSRNGSAQATPTAPSTQDVNIDRSEALKRYLFSGSMGASQQSAPSQQPAHPYQPAQHYQQASSQQAAQSPLPQGLFPASAVSGNGAHPRPTQTSPAAASDPRADQFRSMEDTLRRALKLDSSS